MRLHGADAPLPEGSRRSGHDARNVADSRLPFPGRMIIMLLRTHLLRHPHVERLAAKPPLPADFERRQPPLAGEAVHGDLVNAQQARDVFGRQQWLYHSRTSALVTSAKIKKRPPFGRSLHGTEGTGNPAIRHALWRICGFALLRSSREPRVRYGELRRVLRSAPCWIRDPREARSRTSLPYGRFALNSTSTVITEQRCTS